MECWIAAPFSGSATSPRVIREVALATEELGFTGLVMGEHIAVPRATNARHGYTFEPLVTLGYIAAITERIRIGTSVIVAPLRNPVLLAKEVATLDQLSNGRFTLGVAAGYNEGEFKNLGADMRTRGRKLDETILLLRHLFSGSTEPFRGQLVTLEDFQFLPLPPQGAALPIYVGGTSEAALKRAATLGDIWSAPEPFESWIAMADKVRSMAAEAGRTVKVGVELRWGTNPAEGALAGVQLRGATVKDMREHVRQFEAAGCDMLTIGFGPVEAYATEFVPRMRRFAEAIRS